MGQVDLIAALPQSPKRPQDIRTAPLRLRGRDDHQTRSDGEDCLFKSGRSQRKQEWKTRKSEHRDHKCDAYPREDFQHCWRKLNPRNNQRSQTAKRDRIHTAKIGIILPDVVVACENGPCERPEDDEHEEKCNEETNSAEQPRRERKEEIEHLFDRKRPEDVPVGRQITAMSLKNINVKCKRCEHGAAKASLSRRNDKVLKSGEVQRAENRKQTEKQRPDASKTEQIEVANIDVLEDTPAFERDRGDQKSRDREENLNPELAVPHQRVEERLRNPLGIRHIVHPKASVDVIHEDAKNRQPAQQVDSVKPRPSVLDFGYRLRHRESIVRNRSATESLEARAELENCNGVIRVKDVAGEVDALVAEGDDRAVVGFQSDIEGLGVLRGDSEAKPVKRRVGKLRPGIEKIVLAILHVENVFSRTGE